MLQCRRPAPTNWRQRNDTILGTASAGKNNMPAFKSIYTPDELNDVTAYIQRMLQQGKQ